MDNAAGAKQPIPAIEVLANQRALDKANVAKWGFGIVVFLFAILIIIIILTAQGIGINIVAPVAILGLMAVWFVGLNQGKELYRRFYDEELSSLRQRPGDEALAPIAHLTPREIQVLGYVAQGLANKFIATELGISENTVKNFVSRVLTKLDANDRTEAVVIAIKHGVISVN